MTGKSAFDKSGGARLNAALTLAQLGAYEWDLASDVISMDARCRAIFDFGADESITREMAFGRIHPDDHPRIAEATGRARVELSRTQFEYRIVHSDGTIRSLVSIGDVHADDAGHAVRFSGFVHDVTERRAAEEARHKSEERLGFALDAGGGVGTWDWDVARDRVYSDARFARLFSVDPERAARGAPIDEFVRAIHPEDRDRIAGLIRKSVETGEDFASEYRLVRDDGSVSWVQARGSCHHDERGTPTRFSGVIFDTTDRKALETGLAESERRYRALFNSIDQGYCLCEMVWDAEGRPADYRFLDLNPKFVEATGLSREVAISGTARQIVPGLEDFWVERYGAVVRNGKADRFENHSAVMGRWFDVFVQPVDADRFALIFSDVTVRKQAEAERDRLHREIQEERRRLHQVFEQAPVAILVLRGPEFIVELANPLYCKLLSGRELVGRRFADVMPDLGQEIWAVFHRVMHEGETFVARNWLVPYDYDADGQVENHWFNAVYRPIHELDGEISGFVAVLAEVTEEVLARKELERVNRELEEFAYVASHDLQEPLRMVNIFSELLVSRFGGGDPAATEFSEYIRNGVSRMENLIRDLLSYSRTIHTEPQPASGQADLNESLRDALAVLASRIEETGAEIAAGDLPTVRGDAMQLSQVFQNLIGNSMKYQPAGATPRIRISTSRQPGHWVIAIGDNGIGFESRYSERIFGLFKRLHKDEFPGTGIGLAICQRIVERHGGTIRAEGRPGEGATFFVTLPEASTE